MKNIVYALIALALVCASATTSRAAGNADTYKITVKSIQLKSSNGSWVTIAQPNQQVDIAAANAGAVAASLLSDSAIPAGNYVNFKLVISKNVSVKGSDSASASCVGTHYTKAGGAITLSGTAAAAGKVSTWPADPPVAIANLNETAVTDTTSQAAAGEITMTLSLGAAGGGSSSGDMEVYRRTDLTTPISIAETSAVTLFFKFDTQNTVHCQQTGMASYSMFFTPPGSGTTFGITVDGGTTNFSANDMDTAFPA